MTKEFLEKIRWLIGDVLTLLYLSNANKKFSPSQLQIMEEIKRIPDLVQEAINDVPNKATLRAATYFGSAKGSITRNFSGPAAQNASDILNRLIQKLLSQ